MNIFDGALFASHSYIMKYNNAVRPLCINFGTRPYPAAAELFNSDQSMNAGAVGAENLQIFRGLVS